MLYSAYRHLIRRAFHHFYREFAWSYDSVAALVSAGLWQRWILSALPDLHGRILELGFGPGHLQVALAQSPTVAGLDASPHMVAQAATRLRRLGHVPRLVQGQAQALPFASASFDTLVATFPAEYILAPATQVEISRVLAPTGRLVLIPLAQLAPGAMTNLIDLAYRLTLQAPVRTTDAPEPALHQIQFAGMVWEQRWVPVGPSRVLLLVGTRSEEAHAPDA